MIVRTFLRQTAWLGVALGLAGPALAAEPGHPAFLPPAISSPDVPLNQKLADSIAQAINQSGRVHEYRVDVAVHTGGYVELVGSVTDVTQHDEVLRLAQNVPGVERVIDRLSVGIPAHGLTRVQAQAPLIPPRLPEPLAGQTRPDAPPAGLPPTGPGPALGQAPPPGSPGGPPPAEPIPIFRGVGPTPYDIGPPNMPPYAWPTYAPYNNFSRVAYPEAYPYNAWPFIGPIYPFPKVPLGWRSVKLEWDDGYWWFSKVGTKYDWWKLRFW